MNTGCLMYEGLSRPRRHACIRCVGAVGLVLLVPALLSIRRPTAGLAQAEALRVTPEQQAGDREGKRGHRAEDRGVTPPGPLSMLDHYKHLQMEGWTVRVSRRLIEGRPSLWARVEALLRSQLQQINRVVPDEPLARLHEVPLWVELDSPKVKCACYHPDAGWLRQNGYLVEKVDSVEIGNAERFLEWTLQQPWMLLHELAHAYHERVLGWDYQPIVKAHRRAVSAGLYASVLHHDGRHVRAYAVKNAKEYFAEMCEAYFGTNDFYPFVRAELREHDPEFYKVLKDIWGLPKGAMEAESGNRQ